MGRISNWFNGMLAGLSTWYEENQTHVIMGALGLCIVALIGLSIYIIVDYKKYKVLLDKLKKVNEINNANVVENIEVQNIGEEFDYILIMYQIYLKIYFIFFKETLIKKYF